MNQGASCSTVQNPWEDRASLPPVPKSHAILAAIAVFVAAVGQTLCFWNGISAAVSEYVGIFLLVLLCIYTVKVTRSTPTLALLLGTVFALTFSGMNFIFGAVLLALILSIGAGAFLMTVTGRPYLPLLCYFAAYGACLVITRDPIGSALTLFAMPASLLLGFATRKGLTRTQGICFSVLGLLASVSLILAFYLKQAGVAFERDALLLHAEMLRTQLTDAALAVRNETLELLRSAAQDERSKQLYEQFASLYTDEMLRATVVQLFNLLPSLAIVVCLLLSYEASSFLLAAHVTAGLALVNTERARRVTVSLPASAVFMISFLLTVILPQEHLANAVAQNLTVLLLPALSLVGVQRLLFLFYRAGGGMRMILVIGIGALLCCNTGGALYILAFWGAYCSVGDLIHAALLERMKRNGGNGDPPQ